ncbi:DUF1648 domain-containing protein [Citricoccus sp. NR2]|uniref:DUF1648 domain-containing protein n=1 Tax=Citricoccus sp. NR2 TaxID=3004095 RepID=UPI0022DDC585|nr:DUF1648 domain-containing protein [Citricoccus sp. NR2]WBL19455.1 DUF1648 domain-containing protein [Citricoccus sp. NR2]
MAAQQGRTRLWVPYLLALLILGAAYTWGAVIYDQLPEMLPTGWGPDGEVRGWTEKSFGSVFTPVIIGSGMFILIASLGAMVPAMSPGSPDLTAWGRTRLEAAHRSTIEYLGWVTALITLLLGWLNMETWRMGDGPGSPSMWMVLVILVAIFIIGGPVYRSHQRWADRIAERLGLRPTPEEAAEDALWLPMGLHNDPENPAMMVPKREGYGIGTTVNVGSRKGRVAIVVFAVVVLAPLLLIALSL